MQGTEKHWSIVEYLHETVKNPNIHIRGTHSYYSPAWGGAFEEGVVRYLYGDAYSLAHWTPQWPIDQLYIGDYVCIGAEAVILMGGNHTHRIDWFSLYPFAETIVSSYQGKGDTVIGDGAWIGMRAMIMPGITIGEGAVIAAGAIVTRSVEPYAIVAGNTARLVRHRLNDRSRELLLSLAVYTWSEEKFNALKPYLCSDDIDALCLASATYDRQQQASGC